MAIKPSSIPLSSKLSNYVAVQEAANNPDVFGIEIELEGKHILKAPASVLPYWTQVHDGSLRRLAPSDEAIEYVSRTPYDMPTTEKVLGELLKFLNTPPARVYDSYRTSIHVHVNCSQETLRTIYNFMTLSLLMDELMVSQNGEHRIGNNFCLRAKDALGQLVALTNSIENGKEFFNFGANERYSSINFASLMKFGSMEFRSLECTLHHGRIMHWIRTLQRMKVRSRDFKDPTEIIQLYSRLGPTAFLHNILGPYAMKYVQVPDMDNMLHNGMRLAQDLAYSSAWVDPKPKTARTLKGVSYPPILADF